MQQVVSFIKSATSSIAVRRQLTAQVVSPGMVGHWMVAEIYRFPGCTARHAMRHRL
jgi:hypothetical protein